MGAFDVESPLITIALTGTKEEALKKAEHELKMWQGWDYVLVDVQYGGRVPPSNKQMEVVRSATGMTRRLVEVPLWDAPKEEWLEKWEFTFSRTV